MTLLGLLLMLAALMLPLLGGIWLVNAFMPLPPAAKRTQQASGITEDQLFQLQMLQVQREYLHAMEQLEHEARMTRAERSAVHDCMRDYYNQPRG